MANEKRAVQGVTISSFVPFRIPLVSEMSFATDYTQIYELASVPIIAAPYSTLVVTFQATLYSSTGGAVSLVLYDATNLETIATLTASTTTATTVSVPLVVGAAAGQLKLVSTLYLIKLSVASGVGICGSAYLQLTEI